jgi:hypothetical protein
VAEQKTLLHPEVLANILENLPSASGVGGHRQHSKNVTKELKVERLKNCVKNMKVPL